MYVLTHEPNPSGPLQALAVKAVAPYLKQGARRALLLLLLDADGY